MSYKWKIYYGDGSTFTDADGEPYDAPRTNVQMVVQPDDHHGYELCSEFDYYYFEPETWGWYGADIFTVWDVMVRCRQPLILFGRMLSTPEYRALVTRVLDELPAPKTAWRRGTPSWIRNRR